jgi:hypothetical protein
MYASMDVLHVVGGLGLRLQHPQAQAQALNDCDITRVARELTDDSTEDQSNLSTPPAPEVALAGVLPLLPR